MNWTFWQRNGWNWWHPVGATALLALAVTVTRDTWADIAAIAWRDEESSHILLVPIIAAWLVWVRRGRLRHCAPGKGAIGVAMALAGAILSVFGYYQAVQIAWHGGAVLVAMGALISVLGRDLLFRFLPAFLVLMFLVPVPGRIRQRFAIPLQTTTAQATQEILELTGTPVERSGNLLSINGVQVTVDEACNGLRMVFALVLVSCAFAFGMPLRMPVRLIVLLLSPFSAILSNILRLVPTVWLYGHLPGAQAKVFHDVSGWVMLPIAFALLLLILRVLRWALVPVEQFVLAYD